MSIITRMRKQTAVWWQRTGRDVTGDPSFADPVEIDCRWDDKQELFVDVNGDEKISRATVYVDRDMSPGDWLKLGELESSTPDDPRDTTGAWEMRDWNKMPNLRATEYLRFTHL